jgi:phage terminase small subunit
MRVRMGSTARVRITDPPKFKLTPKQRRFTEEYLIDLNASKAATRAGYSKRTAAVAASKNLGKPEIAAAIAVAQAERSKRTEITADKVLREFADIGFRNIPDKYVTVGEKIQALTALGRHLNLFPTRTEITGLNRGPIQVVSLDISPAEILQLETQMKQKALQYNSSKEIDHE